MRIVVDTSTLIRGLLRRYSEPAKLVDSIVQGQYKLCMTDEMAKELTIAVFNLCHSNNLNTKKYLRSISLFILHAERIRTTTEITSCSDSEDKMFLECAVDAKALFCISSDPSIFNFKTYSENANEVKLFDDINLCNPQSFYSNYVRR